MKICMFQRPSFLGRQDRLGVFFTETTIIDVNFTWQKYFETQNKFHAAMPHYS